MLQYNIKYLFCKERLANLHSRQDEFDGKKIV